MLPFKIINPLLYISPEIAHKLVILALKNGLFPHITPQWHSCLNTHFLSKKLRTPIGIAAGFDKNAEVIKPILLMGFGFTEVGTVTKYPQQGNKIPRIFRLKKEKAIINNLGFNNKGVKYLITQINKSNLNNYTFGVNIGINKDTPDPIKDFTDVIKEIYGLSSYITINISSPNTPGLRDFHNKEILTALLISITKTRKAIDYAESIPFFLKISPDISDVIKENITTLALKYKISGLIISNTTTQFNNLYGYSKGGLSGQLLFDLSTRVLSEIYQLSNGQLILIGCGGISNGLQAYEKIKAGASLLQLYTAMVYNGINVVNKINKELADILTSEGFTMIDQAIGINHK
ncbi:quinone-dependent dihydroorotate dehydrogenase [Neoehrlichia mikurensis]|uniref:Dihydroorotate dehydrogenase (quinone) n=1 Tax=Neoehrlichia mikurensis TaxID=89586 RepID=A0A9Q9BX61_9RICK|nr:quinone-dependent dihydroorotate dehydrogenase [Neoehrlichia mikurensis]QXK92157.1 quinone-dependent dihydroorotate dehydrogenase [Neoehrlichia mikurensis]QXK92613.1 quinone-dependent dihydroorotate dehydrogenase [Neoehrlichia mikurensis]QXK93851.1 quinone-dependent dihydroorotate dehydrogenase [Neoehrlichia mikurensis]UTO55153.1 quinone-dependent dihydroorotate dehydrogenase [Neoehrlichia mikurensis]UTO56073.1 quinone-dependent dihydroorotate dehydrogenase [Neoehrlichia mikurensis]